MDYYEFFKNNESNISISILVSDLLLFGERIAEVTAKSVLERHEEKMYTRDEVAEKFKVSDTTLWRWQNQGLITRKKIGNRVYYPETEIKKLCQLKSDNR